MQRDSVAEMSNVIDPYDEERAPFLHREPGDPLGPDQDESATVSLEESLQNQVVPIVKSARSLRLVTFLIIEGGFKPWDTIFQIFILAVILTNVVLFFLSTVPSIMTNYTVLFDYMEAVSVYIFMVELGLRFWCIIEKSKFKKRGPIKGRLLFLVQPSTIIDLVSVIPFWVDWGIRIANTDTSIRGRTVTQFASAIRVMRIFRIFKADKYTKAFRVLVKVLKSKWNILLVTLIMWVILLIITATAIYYAQKDVDTEFQSIPDSIYGAVLLLTAQGFWFDVPRSYLLRYLTTTLGKWVIAISNIFSVYVFALPAGILASGFEPVGEELIAKKQRKRVERQLMLLKANLLRKKKRLEKGNEADESGAATPTRDHRMPRHFHSRINQTDDDMTDDGSALESPRRVFRRRPPPRSGGIFSEGGYDSTMTTDNESSTTEGDSEYDEYDYDSDEEARPRQIVITVKRPAKKIGRVVTITRDSTMPDLLKKLTDLYGVPIYSVLNSQWGIVGDIEQFKSHKVYLAVTQPELRDFDK